MLKITAMGEIIDYSIGEPSWSREDWEKKIVLIFLSKEDFLKLLVSLLVSNVC